MEQKFYSTVEAADKAGITGAPSGVGKTFRRLAAKLGLVPTKEKGALCWTEADIAEVKANYKPRAKRTATIETPAISANNNETDGTENIIDAPNDEVVTTAQVGEPTNAPVVEETATVETVDVPAADVKPSDEHAEDSGKTITPAVAETASVTAAPAPCQSAEQTENLNLDNTTNGGITQTLFNLPAEILALPRWLKTRDDNHKQTNLFDAASRVDEAERFLNALFGNLRGDRYGYLWTVKGKGDTAPKATYPFKVTDADARKLMARRAIELSDEGRDVYVGVNVGDEPAAPGKRYTKEQITVQTATVTDIDCEGGGHISDAAQIYPPNGVVAKTFLPFAASLVVDSGYGLHGYCLFDEPIDITADNRDACIARNKRYIDAVRARAGVFSKAVDGVGDLPRVLRCPGTFNYKAGKNGAPLCRLVEVNDIRFTPADLDARLDALEPPAVSKQPAEPKAASTPKRQYQPASDEPSEQDRARAMLDFIPCAEQTYEDWIYVGMILKNNGNDVSDWTRWSRDDSRFKDGETDRKWQGFTGSGLTIATLHRLAQFYGYSEKDFRREWYNLRGIKPARRPTNDEPARADVDGNGRDDLIDSLFDGGASDLAFAKRLEKFCGDRVKWCDEAKHWYLYSGGVWKKNSGENSAVSHFANDLADTLQKYAANDAEHKLAAAFQSAKKVGCSIGMLKGRHSVRITLDDLDKHDELLNCLNGVVDLQTGKFYPDADPKLLLTKQAGAAYVPNAQSSLVEDFFTAIQPDEETRAGLLRWLGYCLTAKTNEHKFAVWTGERGANGKSTLSGVMLKLLKSYGTGLASRALLKSNRPADANAATTAINALEGVRFALAEELPIDAEIDSSLVKTLSGGDEINLRLNYGEYRTIPNLAKINISGNYLPRIENVNDGGMRRRLLNFAFNVRFGIDRPADPTLKEKLILPENLQALLALLVREAVAWYRGDGLIISDAMKAETQRQLDASDFVADFLEDGGQYVKKAGAQVNAKEFVDALRAACPECRAFTKRRDLVQLIAAQDGVAYGKDNHNANVFKGIGKAAQDEFDGEPIDPARRSVLIDRRR